MAYSNLEIIAEECENMEDYLFEKHNFETYWEETYWDTIGLELDEDNLILIWLDEDQEKIFVQSIHGLQRFSNGVSVENRVDAIIERYYMS